MRSEEAFLRGWQGRMEYYAGNPRSRGSSERCLALYRQIGDQWGVAMGLVLASWVDIDQGDIAAARKHLVEAESICREHGDTRELAWVMTSLSAVNAFEGRLDDGEEQARQVLAAGQELGYPELSMRGLGQLALILALAGRYEETLWSLEGIREIRHDLGLGDHCVNTLIAGEAELHLGQYETARQNVQMALDDARGVKAPFIEAHAIRDLGWLAVREGQMVHARALFLESVRASEACSFRAGKLIAGAALAYVIQSRADLEQAHEHVLEALRWAAEGGEFIVVVHSLPTAVMLLLEHGEAARAVELYALACTLPGVANSVWVQDVVGAPIAQAAGTLPAAVVAAARERGGTRDVQATLEELLTELQTSGDQARLRAQR